MIKHGAFSANQIKFSRNEHLFSVFKIFYKNTYKPIVKNYIVFKKLLVHKEGNNICFNENYNLQKSLYVVSKTLT